jgi:hypothetical protein
MNRDFRDRDIGMRSQDAITPDRVRGGQRTGKCTGKTDDGRNCDNSQRSKVSILLTIEREDVRLTKLLADFGTRPMPGKCCPVCNVKLTLTKLCPNDEDHTPQDEASRVRLGKMVRE